MTFRFFKRYGSLIGRFELNTHFNQKYSIYKLVPILLHGNNS
jgi:hypothetical protein